ncbi:auxin-responsive protein SAUR36-like [Salvia miltiorrhiza]|uniref:auxin-responsive protein SAUR36-like n=1 Tax=Salvia miltiorrhiza TaxID=226208 RepID=UPI0025AC955D|nr:auxin-responsive protein SAUR36-like [Salvia miltiorrhiza]
MARTRGFSLKHRVAAIFRRPARLRRVKPLCGLIGWAQKLGLKARARLGIAGGRYARVERDPILEKPVPVPKGHMAVYVGQKDGDFERILVPVVYFNHPLFGDLLKESENEFGFNQPGGLTIPCRISEFERVQTRIKTGQCTRKLLRWKSPNRNF